MGIVIKNSLPNFMTRISKSRANLRKDNLLAKLGQLGVDIAQSEYQQSGYNPEYIYSETNENGILINAQGKGIAYSEFGTGFVGQGTYQGKLPTEPITFVSPKIKGKESENTHTTQGWEYYYDNIKTKFMGGWFYKKTFTRGKVAKAQMFKTSQRLREEIPNALKNKD